MVIVIIIVITDTWRSKGTDTVSQWENGELVCFLTIYNTLTQTQFFSGKKVGEFILFKAMQGNVPSEFITASYLFTLSVMSLHSSNYRKHMS